ncbi:response regulator [Synechococcales cyanobacterium C]|uniref:Response regulator n=1 Tax=Petrachloros mirabilis ULC683 TaxID=2781853 RepID=A0A8K2A2H6_9CYAN|nr:response regulator transcription factor [Petrachloros mirabilis]NCJ08591.1 response regulator [Petrachloros mirabilis ULC683]
MSNIRVVLVEDHDLSRIGLKAALQQIEDLEVIGDASNGRQALHLLTTLKPDVAIIDIGLPDIDGIEVTQSFRQQQETADTETKILILTMHKNEDSVLAAFAAGADSYSLKDVKIETLVQAIRLTHEGNAWIDPVIARVVLQQARKPQAIKSSTIDDDPSDTMSIDAVAPDLQEMLETYPLTERELEVLELIVAGCSNSQIAEKLYITVGTVKTHVRNILSKLCADDRTQAAVRALRAGLVS